MNLGSTSSCWLWLLDVYRLIRVLRGRRFGVSSWTTWWTSKASALTIRHSCSQSPSWPRRVGCAAIRTDTCGFKKMSIKKSTKTALKVNCQWLQSPARIQHPVGPRVWAAAVSVRYQTVQSTSLAAPTRAAAGNLEGNPNFRIERRHAPKSKMLLSTQYPTVVARSSASIDSWVLIPRSNRYGAFGRWAIHRIVCLIGISLIMVIRALMASRNRIVMANTF